MNDVTDFLMFMFNAWTPEICQSIFGNLGQHIWSKWQYAAENYKHHALPYFWTSLDEKRQAMLLEAAKKHYE